MLEMWASPNEVIRALESCVPRSSSRPSTPSHSSLHNTTPPIHHSDVPALSPPLPAFTHPSQPNGSRSSLSAVSDCTSLFDRSALSHSPQSSVSSTHPRLDSKTLGSGRPDHLHCSGSPFGYTAQNHHHSDAALTPTPHSTRHSQAVHQHSLPASDSVMPPTLSNTALSAGIDLSTSPPDGRAAQPDSEMASQDGLYSATAGSNAAIEALNNWRSHSADHQFGSGVGYNSAEVHSHHGGGVHARSDSYQSTLSSLSVASSACPPSGDVSLADSWAGVMPAQFAQMSMDPLGCRQSASSSWAYAPSTARCQKFPSLATSPPMPFPNNGSSQQTLEEALKWVTCSLSPIPSGEALAGVPPGYGTYYAPQYLDTQSWMAQAALLGMNPFMDMYGLTPELLAARTSALSSLLLSKSTPSGHVPKGSLDDVPSSGNKKTNLYKTELCRSWEEKGSCRYGSKCQFAHGQEELRAVSRHPKFKTEICRTFWLHGSCPYGKRCCFLHATSGDQNALLAPVGEKADHHPTVGTTTSAHEAATSRLQQRTSSGASPVVDKMVTLSLSNYLKSSPQLESDPPIRSQSVLGHSRSSSVSRRSDHSSPIDGMRIQLGPRFGPRDQVPAQDAPGPRSRLERLRPTSDYQESSCSSLPGSSAASTARYSSFLDTQPPHSAFSDISSILTKSPSWHTPRSHSANGDPKAKWPTSRLSSGSSLAVP